MHKRNMALHSSKYNAQQHVLEVFGNKGSKGINGFLYNKHLYKSSSKI